MLSGVRRSLALFLTSGICCGALVFGQADQEPRGSDKTVTAFLIDDGVIVIDGDFAEAQWEQAEATGNFIQSEPREGQPATEPTEVRLLYDSKNLYVAVRCFYSNGKKGITVNAMNRDFGTLGNDYFQILLDTFYDRRNAVVFATNAVGAKRDLQTGGNGRSFNVDWDVVWYVKTKITETGWQAEFAIPFKSLRFPVTENQVWGINFERRIRFKNEQVYWTEIPAHYLLYRVSLAGRLEGIRGVRQGRNLYIKPYVSTPFTRRENDDWDFMPDAGFDVKYGLTSGLTLDLTVNTDFSQVEADDAQINFTRFSLYFPEKREFFLENREVFEFGDPGTSGFGGVRPPPNDLIPFFSRRIGLTNDGDLVSILGGARVTGRAGKYRVGILTMQTGRFEEIPSTNFTVGRVRRDILANSDAGFLFINKYESGGRYNRTYGADATFRFFNALDISSYVLDTDTPEIQDRDKAGYVRVAWRDSLLDLQTSYISIQDNFNAEVGYVPRLGIRKSSSEFALTPRPEGRIPWILEVRPSLKIDYITDQDNQLETRDLDGQVLVQFNDGSRLTVSRAWSFERLYEEGKILDEVLYPGDYAFDNSSIAFTSNRNHMFSGSAGWGTGGLYNGDRKYYQLGIGFSPSPHFGADIAWNHSDLNFPVRGDFDTDLLSARLAYSFNTNIFLNALIQYSSEDGFVASNIRFNIIHRPLSDFFLVYNESRVPGGEVIDRALIAKLTYLFSF